MSVEQLRMQKKGGIVKVGYTGNRPREEKGRKLEDLDGSKNRVRLILLSIINKFSKENKEVFLVGSIAAGADIIFLELAIELKVKVDLLVPKPWNFFQKDFEKLESSWERANLVRRSLVEMQLLVEYQELVEGARNCYSQVNDIILEKSTYLMSLTNGVSTGLEGGASDLVEQALAKEINVIKVETLNGFQSENIICGDES